MLDLFSTQATQAGFRLQYMEIYNWGTFHKKIVRIAPEGNNSLLTGANGSGKTTFIDALLTLLVPAKKDRFYNQSSGATKKGNRTEESYVCGYYGNLDEEGKSHKRQMFRPKQGKTPTYSVLLVCFQNASKQTITLFQVRWFANGELKRVFGIAHTTLCIVKDFGNFDTRGEWKKRLLKQYNLKTARRKKIEILDGPNKYGERLANLLGMRSTKALYLFNQIVGIKVLGSLDPFIRLNMLEKKDTEAEYQQLQDSFQNLMSAKNSFDKAKEQIKQLKPIVDIAQELREIAEKQKKLQKTKELSVYWFAQKGVALAKKEQETCEEDLADLEASKKSLEDTLVDLREQETNLQVQIQNDEVGQQIAALEKEIKVLEKKKGHRAKKLKSYNVLAQKIKFAISPTKTVFGEQREAAKKQKKETVQQHSQAIEQLRLAKNSQDNVAGEIEKCTTTIEVLQQNKNNISGRIAEIRAEILAHLGVTKEDIPFVGELIKVKEEEKDWEMVVEKVLRTFALQLIVPEKYYRTFNEYVNKTNLRGRIRYQRYKSHTSLNHFQQANLPDTALVHKVDFKPKSLYTDWIKDTISSRFNFQCVADLDTFDRYEEYVVTKSGLLKYRKGSHEKDDSRQTHNKSNYVLGWNNREKLQLLRKALKELQEKEKEIKHEVRSINKKITDLTTLKDQLHDFFSQFTNYDDIDWQTYIRQIQEKKDKKTKLEAANDKVKALQDQLESLQDKIKAKEDEKEKYIKDITKKEKELEEITATHSSYYAQLNVLNNQIKPPNFTPFENVYPDLLTITYANLKSVQRNFQTQLFEKKQKAKEAKGEAEKEGLALMLKFKHPEAAILNQFNNWNADVNQLSNNIEFIDGYESKYDELVTEGLSKFEKDFNKYLQDTITNKIGDFNHFFRSWIEEINGRIKALNKPLFEIDFNTGIQKTYIQLDNKPIKSKEISHFRKLLEAAIPNARFIDDSVDGKKHHFEQHIAPFIQSLTDESWRKKVMDVRTWFTYKAQEFDRATNELLKTYEHMGALSGGEKAQLTYTILGAAIADQFGLTKTGLAHKAFRFIAIDEAFKAQDTDKATYLMDLCKKLHLQVLVVTPSNGIHIVEPYISFVHLVSRQDNGTSHLYNMPIQQYQKEKQQRLVASLPTG